MKAEYMNPASLRIALYPYWAQTPLDTDHPSALWGYTPTHTGLLGFNSSSSPFVKVTVGGFLEPVLESVVLGVETIDCPRNVDKEWVGGASQEILCRERIQPRTVSDPGVLFDADFVSSWSPLQTLLVYF